MSHFDFLRELPNRTKSELESFLISFKPQNKNQSKIFAAIRAYHSVVETVTEQIVLVESENRLSADAYDILKKFEKEVGAKGLRELRRDLLSEIGRLRKLI